jgi:hypothetical protein
VQELARGLQPHFATVEPFTDRPTVEAIRKKLRDFLLSTWNRTDERLLIYYAGHGFTDFNENARADIGYITGSDTPAYRRGEAAAVGNSISFQEIDALNRETRARQVIMLFDSCFSGSVFLTRSDNSDPEHYNYARARGALHNPVRYYITAGGAHEEIPAASPFAQLVLRGLQGEADIYKDGFITAEALGNYLERNMSYYAHISLHPQKGAIADIRLSSGEFIFLTGLAPNQTLIAEPTPVPAPQDQPLLTVKPPGFTASPPSKDQPQLAEKRPLPPPPPPTLPNILPAVASGTVGPALQLGGQRWTITVGGEQLGVEFGDKRVTLSGGHYGSSGQWWATYSVGFQILTDTYVIQIMFVPRGGQIASCSGSAQLRSGGQQYPITACQRLT